MKKIHWDLRRELSEKGWAKFEQDRKNGDIEKNWVQLSDGQAVMHQFDETGQKVNKENPRYIKLIDKATGQYEVILDKTTGKTYDSMQMVTDDTNGGTFNFYAPDGYVSTGSGLHWLYDMRPWGLVGNGANDKTTYQSRTNTWQGYSVKYPTVPNSRIEQINNEIRNPSIKAPTGNYDINQLFNRLGYM